LYTPPVTPPESCAPEVGYPDRKEGAAEGVLGKEGEVVTRQVFENERLDHLLSKELFSVEIQRQSVRFNSPV
jgi:hypothetical protein